MFEGNLASYDADGNLQKRQPTVLFGYPSRADDEAMVARGEPPYVMDFRLHRVNDGTNAVQRLLRGEDFIGRGTVFDARTGNASLGSTTLTGTGSAVFEFALNYWSEDGDGEIERRARLVSVFSAECLQRFVVFRERKGRQRKEDEEVMVEGDGGDSDRVCGDEIVDAERLSGVWEVESEIYETVGGGGMCKRREVCVERRRLDGDELRIVRGDDEGIGYVSKDGRSMMVDCVGRVARRVLFLPGGISVTNSVLVVNQMNGEFYVELGWMVKRGVRYVAGRWFRNGGWGGCCFAVETRLE